MSGERDEETVGGAVDSIQAKVEETKDKPEEETKPKYDVKGPIYSCDLDQFVSRLSQKTPL